jgi:hypothetical protein
MQRLQQPIQNVRSPLPRRMHASSMRTAPLAPDRHGTRGLDSTETNDARTPRRREASECAPSFTPAQRSPLSLAVLSPSPFSQQPTQHVRSSLPRLDLDASAHTQIASPMTASLPDCSIHHVSASDLEIPRRFEPSEPPPRSSAPAAFSRHGGRRYRDSTEVNVETPRCFEPSEPPPRSSAPAAFSHHTRYRDGIDDARVPRRSGGLGHGITLSELTALRQLHGFDPRTL